LARKNIHAKWSSKRTDQDAFSLEQKQTVTDDKKRVNSWIATELREIAKGRQQSCLALTLDGSQLYTSRQWMAVAELPGCNITVTNPVLFAEMRSVADASGDKQLANVRIVASMLYDYLLGHPSDQPFRIINFDYQCSETKNKCVKPRIDMDLAFRRRLFCADDRGSLLALSVSYRCREPTVRTVSRMGKTVAWIIQRGAKYGYLVSQIMEKSSERYAGMFFFFFRIQRLS
jgi:hypothetical protein